jgi:hypothetical protein
LVNGEPTVEDVIAKYVHIKGLKDAVEREAKTKVADLVAKLARLEAYILQRMDQDGVTSFKTAKGTAFKTKADFASVADWDELLRFIKENNAWDLLQKRVSKEAVRSYLDMDQPPPPGVNYGVKTDIAIRKPSE